MDGARPVPLTPQAKKPPVSLRQQPRAVSVRAPKSRPLSGKLQIDAHEQAQAQEQEQKQEEATTPGAGPRRRERSGSMKARPRPFGGKLKIDVDAAEMAAPPVIGSPLGYFPSKKLPSITHEDHPVSMFAAAESHAGTGLLSTASPFLEYGMVVSLVCDDRGGLVAAEGFASRDVRLEKLSYGTIQLRHTKSGKYVSLDPSPISFRGSEYAPVPVDLAPISACCRGLSCDLKVHLAEDDSVEQLRCRQNLFRTYQYIELLIEMIKAPFQCYGGPFSIEEVCSYNDEYMNSSRDPGEDNDELEMRGSPVRRRTDSGAGMWSGNISPNTRGLVSPRRSIQDNQPRRKTTFGGTTTASRQETHAAAMQSLNRIIPAINVLLLHISWANRANELYVVKVAMPVLIELLGNGFQTSLPLSYLLRENRNLVESITGYSSIIRNFFELIATRGKSIRYMQFLVALCTSRGKGVPKTQEAICELLFNPANGYRDDVIIPVRPSDTGFEIYHAFFSTLKGYCFSYLDRLQGAIAIDEIPENELTLAIIRVSRKMAEFGMYSTEDELSRFVVHLFDLLDERTDFVREPPDADNDIVELKKKGYNSPVSSALHPRQTSGPINQHTSSTMKQRMTPHVSGNSDRRSGWGVASQPSTHFKNAVLFDGAGAMSSIRITKERDASRQYNTSGRGAFRTSTGDTSSAATSAGGSPHRHLNKLLMHKADLHVGHSVDVHEMNESNRVVMEIKDEICAIFLLVDQIRVDFLISTLLASFQARHGGPPSSSPTRIRDSDVIHTALFDDAIVREAVSGAFAVPPRALDLIPHGHHPEKISPLAVYLFGSKSMECKLSLTRLGRRSVATVFMQMLMYEYPPLVSKALELLLQQYNQHDQFLKELQTVQLLVSEETITIYNKLKGDVDELRRLAETTEVWMDLTSRSDFERASAVCQLLQSLVRVIEQTKTEGTVSNDEPRLGRIRRQLKLQPSEMSTSEDESTEDDANSDADLLATNSKCTPKQTILPERDTRKPMQHISIEKQPPNRKMNRQTERYVLSPTIGRVSQYSSSHEVIPPFCASAVVAATDDKTIAMEARRLLRNLRAAQFVLNMLVDGAHFYEGHLSLDNDDQHSPGSPTTRSRTKLQKRQRDQIRGVFGKGMHFLRVFCMGDVENQMLVAPYATMIAEYVHDLPIAQELLVAIFADNFPLYNAVPTELINIFVGRLIQDGPDPRYLFFLETLVLCNEQPIVENQLLVLFQLVKSFENAKVLQMFDDATQTIGLIGDLLERSASLLRGNADANHHSTAFESISPLAKLDEISSAGETIDTVADRQRGSIADIGKTLEYHVRLLHLFAACATGKNTRVQEICQQILPLSSLAEDTANSFEEFVYVVDKTIRPSVLQYQAPVQTSLEQLWSMSLKYRERLDCSGLDCEQEVLGMLLWALDMRDKELKSDSSLGSIGSKSPGELPESSLTDTKDDSPLGLAIRDSISNGNNLRDFNGAERTDTRVKVTSSYKLDCLSKTTPVAWGDAGTKQEVSPTLPNCVMKSEGTLETIETKNNGRLLHRLSPRRYYKGLRAGKSGLRYASPKKKNAPLFNLTLSERRTSNASVGPSTGEQTEEINFFVRQHQQFSELDQFILWLQANPRVHSAMRDELNQMVQGILGIETSMKEEYNPHVHLRNVVLSFDLVVARLVEHVEALQDSSYLKTNLTLLNVFCRMIYAAGDSEERHKMQIKLNHLGVTRLVVQLIASRDSDALFASSIEVGVALLDGMNAEVQESFCSYWSEPANEKFFERIQDRIEKACKLIHSIDRASMLHHRHSMFGFNVDAPGDKVPGAADKGVSKRLGAPITSIFRFLQLLCEGHYLTAQRALIAQPHATVSANLVESTTSFLLDTYLALTDMDMGLITQLFETITEYCQGPCVEAQETVANYKFISAVNALLTHSFDLRSEQAVHQLRAAIVITLLSLLEGRSDRVLHTQLVQELNFEALKMNLVEVYMHFLHNHGTYAGNSKCSKDFYLTMGFNIYILLQQLADQYPEQAWWIPVSDSEEVLGAQASQPPLSSRSKVHSGMVADSHDSSPEYRDAFHFFQSKCAKVEVVWDHCRSSDTHSPGRVSTKAAGRVGEKAEGPLVVGFGETKLSSDQGHSTYTGALIPFYFPVHPICFCLTNKSKKKLVWDVSRGADKLSDFYARSDKLVDEMTHQSHLLHHGHISWIARKSEQIKRLSFVCAVIINLVVLLFYRAAGINSRPFAASEVTFIHTWGRSVEPPRPSLWIDAALSMAGTVLIILYSIVLMCYLLNSAPLLIKKGWKRRHRKEQAKRSKRSASSSHHRPADSKQRESFQDTEQLLRSLREREEEYNYLFLPPSVRKRSKPTKSDPVSLSVTSVETKAPSTSGMQYGSPRGRLRARLEILAISIYFLIRSPRVIYSLLQIFISILGSYVNKLYFAFLLLDVVERYKELNNVLRSISRPAKALGVTTLLYLIVVYVFAVVGFFFFREDYTPDAKDLTQAQRDGRAPYTCQRLFQCFLVSLDQGLKSDGGLGSYLRQLPLGSTAHSYGRLAFDVLYNILLVVLLLNLVFGVIIDTFASLRSDDQEKMLDMHGRCFICSIDAYTFDRATKRGFHDHISRDHNMWHYLYLFVHIRKKNITEYNGLELFLAMRMAKKDVSFFPTHRALSLTKRGDLEESHDTELSAEDERFSAASSSFGLRRYAVPPFSPSRNSSLISRSTSSHFSSDQRVRSKRTSSVSFHSTSAARSMGYLDVPAAPGVNSVDRATMGKLEKIESTISTLANAQAEIKEAQQRAEQRYDELLSAISGWQQQQHAPSGQSPIMTSRSLSIDESPPAVSRRPSTHRVNLRPRDTRQTSNASSLEVNAPSLTPSGISRTLDSITPLTLNIETLANTSEGEEDDGHGFAEEAQDWFSASPEPRGPQPPSPPNSSRLQIGTSSLSYDLSSASDDMATEYSASPDLMTPAQSAHDGRQQRSPSSRKVAPRVFSFEFVSDEEGEQKEEDSPRPKPRRR
ncbi:hypothetical protein PHYSODRAFT_308549 [Phytophthora sojae]|uniref:Uncharacterized protein n=1 Tax=Phytophthora sojae (strain P6497) TaxID=1094619 RepID=G4YJZ1_PHYSP|nr:hypothetical protein PHYSODRAFT_308549 [Phytophthora sojae]EGZ27123.1 hypothetical protein PHYSODRAFT_308549 [Phytophthora sojae]|eukprot:XP_009514398.1 hypothetical protein PHYSODRAFT_308549 [Phytophthora sojae]